MTPAERRRNERARLKAGFAMFKAWIPADKLQQVQEAVEKIVGEDSQCPKT